MKQERQNLTTNHRAVPHEKQ